MGIVEQVDQCQSQRSLGSRNSRFDFDFKFNALHFPGIMQEHSEHYSSCLLMSHPTFVEAITGEHTSSPFPQTNDSSVHLL